MYAYANTSVEITTGVRLFPRRALRFFPLCLFVPGKNIQNYAEKKRDDTLWQELRMAKNKARYVRITFVFENHNAFGILLGKLERHRYSH